MEWMQVLALFLANAGLIVWFRSESRSDWRHMDAKTDAIRQEIVSKTDAIRQEMKEFREIVQAEMKDFHGRLCAIEERRGK